MKNATCCFNSAGLIVAAITLIAIGAGFFWVTQLAARSDEQMWKKVLVAGLLLPILAACVPVFWLSALLGVIGGTMIWGAVELPAQTRRAGRERFRPTPPRREKQS